jgi:uncharacterized membrane protein YphA (DoxX/SURF4 family)
MEPIKQYGPLVGRVLLAAIFVWSGLGKITGFAGCWFWGEDQRNRLLQIAQQCPIHRTLSSKITIRDHLTVP